MPVVRPNSEWDEFARRFGHRLQSLRLERGLSQEGLAYAAGLSRYTYQKFEKGESAPGAAANPSLRNVMAIAQVLNIGLDELLERPWPDLRAR